jgi:hypothetical protein
VRRLEERLRQVPARAAVFVCSRCCGHRLFAPLVVCRLLHLVPAHVTTSFALQVELSSEEKVAAAKEQGRAQAASETKALQEELQRLQLRRNADAEAARKVRPESPPNALPRSSARGLLRILRSRITRCAGGCLRGRCAGRTAQHACIHAHVVDPPPSSIPLPSPPLPPPPPPSLFFPCPAAAMSRKWKAGVRLTTLSWRKCVGCCARAMRV